MKIMKKIIPAFLAIITIILVASCYNCNRKEYTALIFQFGKLVDLKEGQGVYFTLPFIQNSKEIFVGERVYELNTTPVTTSDKKSLNCDAYLTWQITDIEKYYQELSSVEAAESRIDTATYSALKKQISSATQDAVISGKDGSLDKAILEKIDLSKYGITIKSFEINTLDLPSDNKQSVYDRMISERKSIAASYTANGDKEASTIRSQTDAQVRQIISNAEATAAATIAAGETEYYQILANAYSASPEKTEFYKFWTGLNSLKESLKNGATYTINEDSPLYDILMNNYLQPANN